MYDRDKYGNLDVSLVCGENLLFGSHLECYRIIEMKKFVSYIIRLFSRITMRERNARSLKEKASRTVYASNTVLSILLEDTGTSSQALDFLES